jgi:CheY-like chemotaxis protein
VKPNAIILDVMMPEQDGWETLILFKAHPLTAAIPVIVVTILTDRELALSLGAADFLHKPVSREQLLAALEQVIQT